MLTKKLLLLLLLGLPLAGCKNIPYLRGAATPDPNATPTPLRPADNSQNQFPSDGSSIYIPPDGSRFPAGGGGGGVIAPPVAQPNYWEARWDGTLNGRFGVEMRLRREGQNLSGVVNYKTADRRSFGVTGQIDGQNGFTLREASGAIWQGRFQSNDVIEGVRPNGPVGNPATPQWPFTLRRVENYSAGSIGGGGVRAPAPASGGGFSGPVIGGGSGPVGPVGQGGQVPLPRPSATAPPITNAAGDSFETFFPAFRAAVQRRDRAALQRYMAPVFAYGNELNVPPAIVFSELDLEGGMNWINLENAIAARVAPYQLPNSPNPARIARYTPPDARYQVVVVFERDRGGQWRWSSMTYPGN